MKKSSAIRCAPCVVCLVILLLGGRGRTEAEQRFPQVRVSTVFAQFEGTWLASPIVAVGDVSNITSFGHQIVDHLPPPTVPSAHDLYWCQGYFNLVAVVKGELRSARRKYLWASTIPECKLVDNNPKLI